MAKIVRHPYKKDPKRDPSLGFRGFRVLGFRALRVLNLGPTSRPRGLSKSVASGVIGFGVVTN